MDALENLVFARKPTARRPLLGVTVLLVEDSRYASEAMRLMCLRSGARIRRADTLENAHRHLAVYRPTVLLVDVGLPDGSGLALLQSAVQDLARIDVILGLSGDATAQERVLETGANGFIEKPIHSLAAFQAAILDHLPKERQPPHPREVTDETVEPDPVAYRDDLSHIAQVLKDGPEDGMLDYVTQFLDGVTKSAQDKDLGAVVTELAAMRTAGRNPRKGVATLSEMVEMRLAAGGPI